MADLRLTMSCWDYDRTRALMDGSVKPDGIELTCLSLSVEETFFRMLRYREFDVSEMSLSSYTVSLFKEERPFIAIPFFPSRFFRHSSIYVNADSGIHEPKDLVGKRVGCP
ncbi:ABC transporter substrate-binding protein, partial [Ancylobacter polymorphus]